MLILVNQLTIPLFLDVANAAAARFGRVRLFTGKVEEANVPIHPNLKITRSLAYNRSNFLTRFLTWMAFTIHLGGYLLFKRNIHQVWVVTNPPLAPFLVRWLSRIKGFSYSVIIFDLYPDALHHTGLATRDRLLFRLWSRANARLFGDAKNLVTLSESMKAAVEKYFSRSRDVRVIPNWADLSFFYPRPRITNTFVASQKLFEKFTIVYSGNLGLTHDLESLVLAAEILKDEPDYVFYIIGDGAKRGSLMRLAESRQLENIRFMLPQPFKLLPEILAAAEVGIVTLGTGAEGISVPSKTYTNLASGVCLLAVAPGMSELANIVQNYQCGLIISPGDFEKLASVLRELHDDRELLNRYRANARIAAESYSAKIADRYIELMESHV